MEKNSSIDNNVNKDINIQAIANRVSRDVTENENDISNNTKTIPIQTLIQLYRIGFRKLIPLHADSRRANVFDNLISEREITQFPSTEGKPVRVIYENVNFWTAEISGLNPDPRFSLIYRQFVRSVFLHDLNKR
jgi:hypothetical protein